MNRRLYLVAFAAVALIAGLSVYVATRVKPQDLAGAGDLSVKADSVPNLAAAKGWINSPPLTPNDLKGKVVIYDFWTYSCVNCVRTLPHLRALYDQYQADGLVVVGIHSPEFDFEKNHDNVARAVKELGVTWPVALDDNMDLWHAFDNMYWPQEYLTDRDGKLRQVYIGEGDYDQKEDDVRTLLGVASTAPLAASGGPDEVQTAAETPEIHFGLAFGSSEFASSPEPLTAGTQTFTAPDPVPTDTFALQGAWTVSDQGIESADPNAAIVLRYRAAEVNIVAGAGADGGASPAMLGVELDGTPMPAVPVTGDDLYRVISSGPSGVHTLVLRPQTTGFQAFSFTFGAGTQ
ncbi:MAG TPA: redoxin domain-containing protein [Acidimicrobiales bacterium]|jgi:thiol-disulfide isomerase/thioredoxin